MLARVTSAAISGIDGYPLTVEVDFRPGLPAFTIVGLPDAGVREARERVIAAIRNSGFHFLPHRITVNLAPAHIKKEGSSFDLPIALGILVAAELLPAHLIDGVAFLGELGLSGDMRSVRGVLPVTLGLRKKGIKSLVVPAKNANEAAIVEGIDIFPMSSLSEVMRFLSDKGLVSPHLVDRKKIFQTSKTCHVDFSEVKGQSFAKRALEIAASGNHNILLIGPPGSGKTLLARRLPTILPDMEFEEALESTKIHSVAGYLKQAEGLIATRPFRSPHHQISDVALIGGGSNPRPGEVSLAHRGVLFLDEFPEFNRNVLESLRQPLEDRFVTVARISASVRYPSDFLLIAASNPCPCGYSGSQVKACVCQPPLIQKYRNKISGPLMDRIDLHVEVPALKTEEITEVPKGVETSAVIKERVVVSRAIQKKRFLGTGLYENAQMGVKHIQRYCLLDNPGKALLKSAIQKLGLSARAHDRILKVARTIADLDGVGAIEPRHVAEAISYRVLDRDANGVRVSADF